MTECQLSNRLDHIFSGSDTSKQFVSMYPLLIVHYSVPYVAGVQRIMVIVVNYQTVEYWLVGNNSLLHHTVWV